MIRKMLLTGVGLLALSGAAKADVIWSLDPTPLEITYSGNPFNIDGTFTVSDDGTTLITTDLVLHDESTTTDYAFAVQDVQIQGGDTFYGFNFAGGGQHLYFEVAGLYPLSASGSYPITGLTPDGTFPSAWALVSGGSVTDTVATAAPEPMSMAILGVGLLGLTAAKRRRFI